MAKTRKRKYENVKPYEYFRPAKIEKRKGPHGTETVVLKAKKVHVKAHKARKPRVHTTKITVR